MEVIMMCQSRFITGNTCATPVGVGVLTRGKVCISGYMGYVAIFVACAQCCCKPKSLLKNKVYLRIKRKQAEKQKKVKRGERRQNKREKERT